LTEWAEEPADFLFGNPNARVAYFKAKRDRVSRGRLLEDRDRHLALGRNFTRSLRDSKNLAQTSGISSQLTDTQAIRTTPVQVPLRGTGGKQFERPSRSSLHRVQRFDFEFACFNFREVQYVVSTRQQGLGAVANGFVYSRCSFAQAGFEQKVAHPMTPFMGVRISWLMLARKALFASVLACADRARVSVPPQLFPFADIADHAEHPNRFAFRVDQTSADFRPNATGVFRHQTQFEARRRLIDRMQGREKIGRASRSEGSMTARTFKCAISVCA